MRTNIWTLIAITGMAATVAAQGPCAPGGCNSNGTCQHGAQCGCCTIVTEMVPVKKIVYSTKCVPVCELHPGCLCDCGPTCKLFYKNVLVKREIVVGHKCVTKCVLQ